MYVIINLVIAMKEIIKELNKRKLITNKLLTYGFIKDNNKYVYKHNLIDDFDILVEYDHILTRRVVDNNTNDEYTIIDLNNELGTYAAKVLDEANKVIDDIIDKCSEKEEFLNNQTKEVINYIKRTYKDIGDHPWEDNNMVIRHKNNKKWYALLMEMSESKFKDNSTKDIEVINLKCNKPSDVINNINIFPAYHMSKKSWISIILDGSLDNEIVYSLIDMSYELTK